MEKLSETQIWGKIVLFLVVPIVCMALGVGITVLCHNQQEN